MYEDATDRIQVEQVDSLTPSASSAIVCRGKPACLLQDTASFLSAFSPCLNKPHKHLAQANKCGGRLLRYFVSLWLLLIAAWGMLACQPSLWSNSQSQSQENTQHSEAQGHVVGEFQSTDAGTNSFDTASLDESDEDSVSIGTEKKQDPADVPNNIADRLRSEDTSDVLETAGADTLQEQFSAPDGETPEVTKEEPNEQANLPEHGPIPVIRADVVQWVKSWNYGSDEADRFQALQKNQIPVFATMIAAFLRGDWREVQRIAPSFGMVLSRLEDSTDGKKYLLLAEASSPGVGLGLFLRPEQFQRALVLQVPHPIKDIATNTQGAVLLRALQPMLLMVASIQRCDSTKKSPCDGTTTMCNGFYPISDVAHFTDNGFHTAHTVVAGLQPVPLVLQLHGFAWRTGEPSAFVSNGTSNKGVQGSMSVRLRDALNTALKGSGLTATQSCNDPNDTEVRLCSSANVQGRYSNGVTAVCTQSSTKASEHFIHLEQRKELRTGTPGPIILERALRLIFP